MATFTVDGTEFEMIDAKMTFAEARAVEKVTGISFQQITTDEHARQSLDVVQALIWVSMKRQQPDLKFSDLDDLAIDSIEWSADEEAEEEARPTEGEASPALPISA